MLNSSVSVAQAQSRPQNHQCFQNQRCCLLAGRRAGAFCRRKNQSVRQLDFAPLPIRNGIFGDEQIEIDDAKTAQIIVDDALLLLIESEIVAQNFHICVIEMQTSL